MNITIDGIHWTLSIMLILLLIPIFMYFFKKQIAIRLSMATVLLLTVILLFLGYRGQFTTFEEYASNGIQMDDLHRMQIIINDVSSDYSESIALANIHNEEVIRQVLDDFSNVELKRDADVRYYDRKYRIQITSRNYFSFYVDEDYLDHYEIINDTDHLNTIRSLIESDDVHWVDLRDE
ncbi:hypothetical protein QA612_13910 [Evansella sp. AB-P1]|uniref:hypothetical protein n=1 Tax=Evansella sp. AB-P1 TaxID=3037653 RepID=UPI00241E1E8F|nr:hypothetical protein [Evansella sp. AB-P1]MDG5788577.1 hypothetical protein [Evansella sp. AB-P1]